MAARKGTSHGRGRLTTTVARVDTLIGVGIGPGTEHVGEFYPRSIASVPVERFAATLAGLIEGELVH